MIGYMGVWMERSTGVGGWIYWDLQRCPWKTLNNINSFICTHRRTQLSPVISMTDRCTNMIDYQHRTYLWRIRAYKDISSLGIAYLKASINAAECWWTNRLDLMNGDGIQFFLFIWHQGPLLAGASPDIRRTRLMDGPTSTPHSYFNSYGND